MRQEPQGALFACREINLDLGGRPILLNISLSVHRGEVLGIMGPNGAGKTSLFEVLSGRMPPKSGQVFFNKTNITKLPLHQRAQLGIGRSYQTPVVPEALTVAQVFKAARQAHRPFLVPDQAEWGANLAGFHVPGSMIAEQLDTLDRRKLLPACLLMRRPKLLLMDEPAAGLINSEIDELDEILRVLAKELNITILIVEHRMELLETIADRVIVMDAGEIVSQGTLTDVLADPKVRAAYFERSAEEAGV